LLVPVVWSVSSAALRRPVAPGAGGVDFDRAMSDRKERRMENSVLRRWPSRLSAGLAALAVLASSRAAVGYTPQSPEVQQVIARAILLNDQMPSAIGV